MLTAPRLKGGWRDEAAYFVIFNTTNVLNYAYLILVGFLVSTDSYGLFGALFGLVYLASALGNMVKMAVARQIATVHARSNGCISRRAIQDSLTWPAVFAVAVGLVSLASVPVIMLVFDSASPPVIWACLAIALSIWVPASQGVLQGLQRFSALGSALLWGAAVRTVVGLALVAAGFSVSGAIAGIAIGLAASGVAGVLFCLRESAPAEAEVQAKGPGLDVRSMITPLLAAIVIATHTSLDVAIVRYLYASPDAGVYTGIAVLGRVIIFAAVAVPFTFLPKVAARAATGEDSDGLLWKSLALTALISTITALALLLVVDVLHWQLVGTDVSSAIGTLHWYVAATVVFSLTTTVIYYQVGRGNGAFILLAVLGIVVQTVSIFAIANSLTDVAQVLFVGNVILLSLGLLLAIAAPLRRASLGSRTSAVMGPEPSS